MTCQQNKLFKIDNAEKVGKRTNRAPLDPLVPHDVGASIATNSWTSIRNAV